MKLTNYFFTIATACDLSNDASYGFFKQNLAQIDSVIENYFEMENMTTRKIQNIIFFGNFGFIRVVRTIVRLCTDG